MDSSLSPEALFRAVLKNTDLPSRVQNHLSKVYSTLAATTLAAGIAAYLGLNNAMIVPDFMTLLTPLLGFGLLMGIFFTNDQVHGKNLRFGLLLGFGICQGLGILPLLQIAVYLDRGATSLITSALVSTSIVFASFSATALWTRRRSYLFLGSILSSTVGIMLWMSFFNRLFYNSEMFFNAELLVGLLVFAGYVIYDTQIIVERSSTGIALDEIKDAANLFVDFVGVFVRILIVLMKRKAQEDDEKQHRRRTTRR